MSYKLIVSEKPQAAQKIAEALADSKPKKVRKYNVNYYEIEHEGEKILIGSAVGHLYGLGEKGGESWKYPVFETEWKPTWKMSKDADYTKDYIKTLENLGENADEIIVASDFDIEGEVIGLNVVRYALNRNDASRMKFSTLTKKSLIEAYAKRQNHLEWGQAKAGETRHTLDWYYGINLSRAFTQAIKKGTNRFKVLSTGRVQGPALHFLAERERKILAFTPETFWEIYLNGICKSVSLTAQYELPLELAKKQQKPDEDDLNDSDMEDQKKKSVDKSKIFDESWKKKILEETQGKDGEIKELISKRFRQAVPTPFDLTSLQMEASNNFGYSPKRTLEIAQKLYISGVTSYPRTSSQKLPQDLDLKSILEKLSRQKKYLDKVSLVKKINSSLKPNEGKKEDAAHPAIHPTGEIPSKLTDQELKVYDLIVKRFFAVFGEPAIRESNTIYIDINQHLFTLKGTRTIEKNWHELYEPYVKLEDVQLPNLSQGDLVENKKIFDEKKETSPPKRFTDASIIKELEKRNIGTKATRSEILSHLRDRGYIVDKSIKVTELGLKMDDVLSEEVPNLVDEELTRSFEDKMEEIRQEKEEPSSVLKTAKDNLTLILEDINKKEVQLGQKLADASQLARIELAKIAKCPSCESGTLVIKKSKKTKRTFIACDQYPKCKTIFNAPQNSVIKSLDEDATDKEGKIWILTGKTENKLQKVCINPETPEEEEKELGHKKYDEEGMTCPVCKTGKMILRKSFYGEFLGCDQYPKCKTMMRINKNGVDTTPISPAKKTTKKTAKKTTKKKPATKKTKSEK